jgi:hypothetical protein
MSGHDEVVDLMARIRERTRGTTGVDEEIRRMREGVDTDDIPRTPDDTIT